MVVSHRAFRVACAVGAALLATAASGSVAAYADDNEQGGNGHTLYVALNGHDSGSCTRHAPCATIGFAVGKASAGNTVSVKGGNGSYRGQVVISKSLTLSGNDEPKIDATGQDFGIAVRTSDVTIEGFSIRNAVGEGILVGEDAMPGHNTVGLLTRETIRNNRIEGNNTGFQLPTSPVHQTCVYPGDCGGGIHLNVVAHSRVLQNTILNNAEGILVTDDYGPNFDNLIEGNTVGHNHGECGITMPGHNPFAVKFAPSKNDPNVLVAGQLTPGSGGIFDETVKDNVVFDNGTANLGPFGGSGSGVLLAASFPGSAVYNNTIVGNVIYGNGLAGVTLHAHHGFTVTFPNGPDNPPTVTWQIGGEYVSGNRIEGNKFGTNNIRGDSLDAVSFIPGITFPGTAEDFQTTAILLYSASPMTIRIEHNRISDNKIGIWQTYLVHSGDAAEDNSFDDVTTKVFTSSAL